MFVVMLDDKMNLDKDDGSGEDDFSHNSGHEDSRQKTFILC